MTNLPSKFCATSEMFESNFEFANQSFRVGDSMEWVMEKLLMTELWQKGSFLIDVNKECFKQSFSLSMGTENKKKIEPCWSSDYIFNNPSESSRKFIFADFFTFSSDDVIFERAQIKFIPERSCRHENFLSCDEILFPFTSLAPDLPLKFHKTHLAY